MDNIQYVQRTRPIIYFCRFFQFIAAILYIAGVAMAVEYKGWWLSIKTASVSLYGSLYPFQNVPWVT